MGHMIQPVHPGKILLEEFLIPLEISQYKLAKDIHVPARRINEIVKQKRSVTADTALRLAFFFGNSAAFWLGLQKDYELDVVKIKLKKTLQKQVQPFKFKLHQSFA